MITSLLASGGDVCPPPVSSFSKRDQNREKRGEDTACESGRVKRAGDEDDAPDREGRGEARGSLSRGTNDPFEVAVDSSARQGDGEGDRADETNGKRNISVSLWRAEGRGEGRVARERAPRETGYPESFAGRQLGNCLISHFFRLLPSPSPSPGAAAGPSQASAGESRLVRREALVRPPRVICALMQFPFGGTGHCGPLHACTELSCKFYEAALVDSPRRLSD